MTDARDLLAFLETDPRDVGCERAWELVHVYAEMVGAGEDPEALFPGVTAHLGSCGPCEQDFQGLLTALRHEMRRSGRGTRR